MINEYTIHDWQGYEKRVFEVDGRQSFIICPKTPLPGNPWVWRTEFFGAFDQVDRALLADGFYLAYHQMCDMYGCPQAVSYMQTFYESAKQRFALSSKPVLFGFSRGGLYACQYAAAYPDRVGALYLDAPVLDVRSWPGGKGVGAGDPTCWEQCRQWYGIKDADGTQFHGNPLDKVKDFKDVPIILVAGGADDVVPYPENGEKLVKLRQALGSPITAIVKPDCNHHPHSLEDPTPVVAFIKQVLSI